MSPVRSDACVLACLPACLLVYLPFCRFGFEFLAIEKENSKAKVKVKDAFCFGFGFAGRGCCCWIRSSATAPAPPPPSPPDTSFIMPATCLSRVCAFLLLIFCFFAVCLWLINGPSLGRSNLFCGLIIVNAKSGRRRPPVVTVGRINRHHQRVCACKKCKSLFITPDRGELCNLWFLWKFLCPQKTATQTRRGSMNSGAYIS